MAKKVLAIVMCIIMMLPVVSAVIPPIAAAEAVPEYPIITIGGYQSGIVSKDGETLYPLPIDGGEEFSKNTGPILKLLAKAVVTNDYTEYCDALYHAFADIYKDIKLDNNGERSDGSRSVGEYWADWQINAHGSGYWIDEYVLTNDWRIDPCFNAERLSRYVDDVLRITGKDKVRFFVRCEGTSVAQAYFEMPESEGKVDAVMYYMPSVNGFKIVSKLFSGKIILDPDKLDHFVKYNLEKGELISTEDDYLTSLLVNIVSLLNQIKLLGFTTDVIQTIYDKVRDDVLPRILRDSYGSFPGFWSMVQDEDFEDAKKFVFGGVEDEYAGMIEKIDYYHYNVYKNRLETTDKLVENGMGFGIYTKYNTYAIPVYKGCEAQGDRAGELTDMSYGATSADFGKVLPDSYIKKADPKYLSPDRIVDASTARYRDTTWFVRDCPHMNQPYNSNTLFTKFLQSGGKMTVFDDPEFPQFMDYNKETHLTSPMTSKVTTTKWTDHPLQALLKFLTAFLNYIRIHGFKFDFSEIKFGE